MDVSDYTQVDQVDESDDKGDETLRELLVENANAIVSEGGVGAKSIAKIIKHDQEVIGYELSDGSHVSMDEAIQMAKENQLEHVGVSTSKKGEPYIRSLADGDPSNNLSNLPILIE